MYKVKVKKRVFTQFKFEYKKIAFLANYTHVLRQTRLLTPL